ncbi:VOC family protein [Maribacter algarum]|uniref:VOC family protein n=1 Tax=Maribacter algarum (ex Zhang et al. 2020) TaxID=2578118 RepID=A0A5S3PGQ1_9FLAO|nr:VOC family protein [Maribacter algarum]TMM53320.1 VOC family protein [Maribacter algarum]
MSELKLEFLDHVAINVADVEASADWYKKVLGLKKYKLERWGEYPVFMLSGKTGLAIFPADLNLEKTQVNRKSIRIDHFAFNVTNANFKTAQKKYDALGLDYTIQDHFYFHSIYTKDLDGHIVELTTLMVDEESFYQQ